MADDFQEVVKKVLAARVGNLCSNPALRCHLSDLGLPRVPLNWLLPQRPQLVVLVFGQADAPNIAPGVAVQFPRLDLPARRDGQ